MWHPWLKRRWLVGLLTVSTAVVCDFGLSCNQLGNFGFQIFPQLTGIASTSLLGTVPTIVRDTILATIQQLFFIGTGLPTL